MKIDTSRMKDITEIDLKSESDHYSLYALLNIAKEFLLSHKWCKAIDKGYLDIGIEGILCIFYFRIEHDGSADNEVWVVVGDLPSAYITVGADTPNGACALDAYMGEMEEWINAVKENRLDDIDKLIPVNVEPTIEYAEMLESRFNFIDDNILCNYQKELKEGD